MSMPTLFPAEQPEASVGGICLISVMATAGGGDEWRAAFPSSVSD